LLTRQDRLVQVEVLDNGRGMDEAGITGAMTLGRRRKYRENDLGHFGMGLKAASFGHSDVLTVWSRSADSGPVGRRIRRADFSTDFSCEVLAADAASAATSHRTEVLGTPVGPSVVWTQIRNTYRGKNEAEATRWLAAAEQDLRTHIGLTFHRVLAKGRLTVIVLVDELTESADGMGVPVVPIDPFSYASPGDPGTRRTSSSPRVPARSR